MRPSRLSWLLPFLLASVLRAAPAALALGDNETLTYRVAWAILPGAGEIKIAANAAVDPTGTRLLRIVSTTSTRGLAGFLLPFQARSESLFDDATGRLLWLGETSDTRSKHAAHTVTFDYAKHAATYVEGAPDKMSERLAMPGGETPTDLITCLLDTRHWNLHPGGTHEAVAIFENEFYELTVHALGYEDVWTPLGTFHTLILEPRMEKTPPKGMFKRGSTVRVWIAEDRLHLPVQFQVRFKLGAGVATLVDYRPPAVAVAAK